VASEQNSTKHVLLQGVFGIVGALIGAAATLGAAWIGALPDKFLPPASAAATVTVTASPAPTSGPSLSATDAAKANPQWLAEVSPLTEVGLWKSGQGKIRGETYTRSLVVATEWGDDAGTSRRDYALDGQYTRLTGKVGIADGGHSTEEANFQVLVDGSVAFEKQIKVGESPAEINLKIPAAKDLRLQVTDIDNSAFSSKAVFAEMALN
jgi:hypothetical protein